MNHVLIDEGRSSCSTENAEHQTVFLIVVWFSWEVTKTQKKNSHEQPLTDVQQASFNDLVLRNMILTGLTDNKEV